MRIKICGITNQADAEEAARLEADAIGLNFYERSPRFVSEETACRILRALPAAVEPVALFVDQSFDAMARVAARLPNVRTIQFHGASFEPCPGDRHCYIPAFAVENDASLQAIIKYVERCRSQGQLPHAILVDAHVYGGSGRTAPWHMLSGFDPGVPVILAGGLTPENVAEAIRRVRPSAVDVASGVESSPGRKNHEKMRKFIAEACEAFSIFD